MKLVEFDSDCPPSSFLTLTALLVARGLDSQVSARCSSVDLPLSFALDRMWLPIILLVFLTYHLFHDRPVKVGWYPQWLHDKRLATTALFRLDFLQKRLDG
jgi:hypothetical protein